MIYGATQVPTRTLEIALGSFPLPQRLMSNVGNERPLFLQVLPAAQGPAIGVPSSSPNTLHQQTMGTLPEIPRRLKAIRKQRRAQRGTMLRQDGNCAPFAVGQRRDYFDSRGGMIAAAKSTTLVAEQLLEKAAPLRSIVSSRGRIAVKSG